MDKIRMNYFDKEDILHLIVADGEEKDSVEISPNITVELGENGELIGIEILDASRYIRDSILETAQARLLNLGKS
ncbi:MAG: DUF2283 domain-containing protein [Planctomycetes bacterium]|nr:DUF2283 domain-containing protein [Planctomycetota bacterium]